ncbi:MAG: transcription antitermination factor NusB [Raoultibacter sp.]|jgi:16S rRNA (cytosine967-C5)-methyltransferase
MSKQGPHTRETSARRAALLVGQIVRTRRAFTQEVISKHIDSSELATEERAFATRLALGVTTTCGTLDDIINRCLRAPSDINPDVRDALRISCYEIIFLGKDAHAAVDQGVELAKSVTPKVSGLANVVLRGVLKLRESFPFGDINTDDAALARYFAFPEWLTKRLIADLGREKAILFMKASNEPAPLFLAVNNLKLSDDQVLSVLRENAVLARKVSPPGLNLEGCLRLQDSRALQIPAVKELFAQGAILVSDAASQAIASLMTPEVFPKSYLEIGAGRGTKTILLQSTASRRFGKQMPLSVLDNHEFKVKLLKQRMKEYDVAIEKAYLADARDMQDSLGDASFENIFIDAPCSGLGTLRRHPEIRWRLEPESITSLAETGLNMLVEASRHVAVGGILGYATCTVLKEENSELIYKFLQTEIGQRFVLQPIQGSASFSTSLSPGSSDAHFAVRIKRQS